MSTDRHSIAESRELISDPIERARREAANGIIQFEMVLDAIRVHVSPTAAPFELRSSLILKLQDAALRGIDSHAGSYRNTGIAITGSKHEPPPWYDVADEVASLCSYVNANWGRASALHLAAYVLWRLNWIHPFIDGNGRTARAVSYLVMSVKLDTLLPGTPTIPEQIAADKGPYYDALEAADAAIDGTSINVSSLEQMLESMLLKQLLNVPSLSEAAESQLQATLEARVRRAPARLLERQYGTPEPTTQLWAVGDHLVLQVGEAADVRSAGERRASHGSPFPHLLAIGDAKAAVLISSGKQATYLRDQHVNAGSEYAFALERDASIALVNTSVDWEERGSSSAWSARGSLYIVRLGTRITRDNFQKTLDLLISRDLNSERSAR